MISASVNVSMNQLGNYNINWSVIGINKLLLSQQSREKIGEGDWGFMQNIFRSALHNSNSQFIDHKDSHNG